MGKWFRLTSRNSGDQKADSFEWDCHNKGNALHALSVVGVDPCTAQAAKEAGYSWHGASERQTKEIDGLQCVPVSRMYAIYFPLGSDEAARVQEYFGDVAAEGTKGSMSLLEWMVLMQVIPSPAAQKAVDEWTAAWRWSKQAPDDTWCLCGPDEERMRIVIEATEAPMLIGSVRTSQASGPPEIPTPRMPPVQLPQAAFARDADPDEDDPFEQEEHT
jgi:hypothetical protein